MTLVQVKGALDASDFVLGIRKMRERGKHLTRVMREIKPDMRADQRDHAKARSGPESKWAPRAKSTIERFGRSKTGRRLSPRPLGKLLSAITYTAGRSGVVAESRVSWSGIHQWGGTAGRGAKIPARPFLWLSASLVANAAAKVRDYVLAGFDAAAGKDR